MHGSAARVHLDLFAAAEAVGDDDGIGFSARTRGKSALSPILRPRSKVSLGHSEGAGHSAAALRRPLRVDIEPAEQRFFLSKPITACGGNGLAPALNRHSGTAGTCSSRSATKWAK